MDYESLIISPDNIAREKAVLQNVEKYIKEKKSWVFDAGAGAGKTFALVQTIKRIIALEGTNLKRHNQKILCITYTNVAAEEIKKRLGSANLLEVSTIHDCVWGIISPHQKQLVCIHRRKLLVEIQNLQNSLESEKWGANYKCLLSTEKELLKTMLNENKENYYKNKSKGAGILRNSLPEINNKFPSIMKNMADFKKISDFIFKIQRYVQAVMQIDSDNSKFKKVKYDARFNNDRLETMRISHDTLLEYTERIICENDLLKQLISDQYPFVLVDEYQDTSPLVVKTLNMVDEYAKKISHIFVVGYYGDVKQNIYETGVGIHLNDFHKGLQRIEKVFNRRCSPVIITVANKIRNDNLIQESIYENFPQSNVSFYNIQVDRQEFIQRYIERWDIDENNKLHCFELTNENVAGQSGFGEVYNFYKNSVWYKRGKNYEFLREHVLSSDEKKLGIVQKLIFRVLDFKYKLNQNNTMVLDILKEDEIKDINIFTLRNLINKLQKKSGKTLGEYIINIFDDYGKGDSKYDKCIKYIIAEEVESYEELKRFTLDQLYYFSESDEYTDEDMKKYEKDVDEFFEISIKTFELWHDFIRETSKEKVLYHTYHGTKGREFDNVIIFMNSKFGKKDNYFGDLLKVLTKKNEEQEVGTDIAAARNLLYVAVTRATKNLCIVYFDNLEEALEPIQSVFGEIKKEL